MSRHHTSSSSSRRKSSDLCDASVSEKNTLPRDLDYDGDNGSCGDLSGSATPDVFQTPQQSPKATKSSSSNSSASAGATPDSALDFGDVIEQLLEKRATVRESALRLVIAHLSDKYRPESVESSFHTLQSYLLRCARRGASATESNLACKALALVYLTAGEEREATFRELSETIKDSMLVRTSGAKAALLRGPVAALLATACFVAGSDEDCVEMAASMQLVLVAEVDRGAQKLDSALAVTLVQGIGVLCSFPAVNADTRAKVTDALMLCLRQGMPAPLRVAAARTLAMFSERFADDSSRYRVDITPSEASFSDDEDEDEDKADDSQKEKGDKDDYSDDELHSSGEILASMERLSVSSVKSVAGGDRKSMRAAFRDVSSFLDGSKTPPLLKIKIGKRTEVISTWVHHIRYDMLKAVLGTGLNAHMARNDVVRFALDFDDIIDTKTSEIDDALSRKHVNQKSGVVQKFRTMDLKKQRQNKAAQRSHI